WRIRQRPERGCRWRTARPAQFRLHISGGAAFKPDAAFDDGKALWLRLPAGALQNWPVPLIKDGSDYVVVNSVTRGRYLVVQRLADT
ncbi:TrbG/VirB9 family P-type conjugative transfer protein, partial [Acinetobacter baumannii]